MDEKAWLIKLKQKDPEALQLAFAEINPYLFKFLSSQNVFSPVAEDLVQSAWEIFFTKIDSFEGKSKIRVYLAGIVLNKVREHRREVKKTVYEEDSEKIYAQSFTSDGWWVNEPPDPHALIESQEVHQFIQECMEGLSDSQREAFLMREVNGENTSEICNILQVNVTHLGVLLFRAKDKLRKCLEGKL